MTKNDHLETQKCHFWAFLATFKISFSSLQHTSYDLTELAKDGGIGLELIAKGPVTNRGERLDRGQDWSCRDPFSCCKSNRVHSIHSRNIEVKIHSKRVYRNRSDLFFFFSWWQFLFWRCKTSLESNQSKLDQIWNVSKFTLLWLHEGVSMTRPWFLLSRVGRTKKMERRWVIL